MLHRALRFAIPLLLALTPGCGSMYMPRTAAVPVRPVPEEARAVRVRVTKVTVEGPHEEHHDRWVASMRPALESSLTQAGFQVLPANAGDADLELRFSAVEQTSILDVYEGKDLLERLTDPPTLWQCGKSWDDECVDVGIRTYFVPRLVNLLVDSPRLLRFAAKRQIGGTVVAAGAGGLGVSGGGSGAPAAAPTQHAFLRGRPRADAYALVVGIERYRDVPAPSGARRDATTFAAIARDTLGVPEANVRLLLDDRATKSDLERELDWLELNVPAGGRIYFFFSGHGAPDASEGSSYVLPYDTTPSAIARTGLALQAVLRRLGESRAQEVVAIVDACFSGAGGRSVLPPGARPLVRTKDAKVLAKEAVLSAASGSQITGAIEGGSAGLFTSVLADGLGKGEADADGDGAVSLGELKQWMSPRISREARRQNREQDPSLTLGRGMTERTPLAVGLTKR